MPEKRLLVEPAEVNAAADDRFHRFGLIGWWDQHRLARAKVLVVGAGALGNEIIKNLALLGVGNVFIADLDRVENSNLSRSVLYRQADNGRPKADVAARAARDLYPGMNVRAFTGDVACDLGLGVFRWADVVLAGLDSREARLAVNRACWKVNRPWVDGAIEEVRGWARVFVPDGPCYECGLSALDWQLVRQRRSCNLLTRPEMEGGKTPTTPTVSSVIAGVQCQEAVKLLHGLPVLAGRGWVFDGLSTEAYQVEYQRRADCYGHDVLDEVVAVDRGADDLTAGELLDLARERLGPAAELELGRDVLEKLVCPCCRAEQEFYTPLAKVPEARAPCPDCPGVRREVVTFYKIRGTEPFLGRPLSRLGVPPFDIIFARAGGRSMGLELRGDAPRVLGRLAADPPEPEWV